MNALIDRFIRYTTVDTQSTDGVDTTPSSPGQMVLARMLADELRSLGVQSVTVDNHAYVTAHIPGRGAAAGLPRVGLLAHLDTAGEFSGKNVRARVVAGYDGSALDLGHGRILDPAVFPTLQGKEGKTLIITDGSTLLGGDDKAGIAIIMTVLETLRGQPDLPHPPLAIAFTPDEEIGHGASLLDLEAFAADYAYTVDGGEVGTIEYENFNAAYASVTFTGRTVHPGEAKGLMINAILLAQSYLSELPEDARPESTEGREGFFHVDSFSGSVEEARIGMLVRDHSAAAFDDKKALLRDLADRMNARYDTPRIVVDIKDQYRNMVEKIEPVMRIVDQAKQAMADEGIVPVVHPIRGGTDGARLSWRGLPCPNLFFGGYNMHGPYEYAVAEEMGAAVRVIVRILTQQRP